MEEGIICQIFPASPKCLLAGIMTDNSVQRSTIVATNYFITYFPYTYLALQLLLL